jgi:hypothetical protein
MAKPIIEERGLRLVPLKAQHIAPFIADLSPENMREFESLYQISPAEALISCLEDPFVFAVKKGDEVVAVTGLFLFTHDAVMWSLFSKNLRKHWISFARASRKLVDYYHTISENIRCEVWSENLMIHQWLLHLGFLPDSCLERPNGHTVIRFVRCGPELKSVQTASPRPVLH